MNLCVAQHVDGADWPGVKKIESRGLTGFRNLVDHESQNLIVRSQGPERPRVGTLVVHNYSLLCSYQTLRSNKFVEISR